MAYRKLLLTILYVKFLQRTIFIIDNLSRRRNYPPRRAQPYLLPRLLA